MKNNRPITMRAISSILAVAALNFSSFAQAQTTLTFGVAGSEKPSDLFKQMKPITDYLENFAKQKGVQVKFNTEIEANYEKAQEKLASKKFDLMRAGSMTYVIAKEMNSNIAGIGVESEQGAKNRPGCIITKTDSPIKSVADIKGKTFAFGDNTSSVTIATKALFVKSNITSKDLKSFKHLDRHDKVAFAVAAGEFDAGTCACEVFEKNKSKGLKSIATVANMSKVWAVRDGLDPKVTNVLKEGLLALKKDSSPIAGTKIHGFFPFVDSEFEPLSTVLKDEKKF